MHRRDSVCGAVLKRSQCILPLNRWNCISYATLRVSTSSAVQHAHQYQRCLPPYLHSGGCSFACMQPINSDISKKMSVCTINRPKEVGITCVVGASITGAKGETLDKDEASGQDETLNKVDSADLEEGSQDLHDQDRTDSHAVLALSEQTLDDPNHQTDDEARKEEPKLFLEQL